LVLFTLVAAAVKPLVAKDASEPIDIGAGRELFVDGLLIGRLDGAKPKMHEPHD
jgi:hypothetical protein